MIREDENALICDMAETYHIYDYRQLKPLQAAIFAAGLPANSRIKRKLAGQKHSSEVLLLACIADSLRTLIWFQTKDGQRGVNRPPSILAELTGDEEELEEFASIEEYEAARARNMEN